MLQTNIPVSPSISAIKAKVDVYNGSTLVKTCTCKDYLQDFTLNREGDTSKFFGFGVSHKMAVTFIDIDRTLNVQLNNTLEIALGDGVNFDEPYPTLYITEVEREEKSNNITCTAYDALYFTSDYTVSDLELEAPYSLVDLVTRCAEILKLEVVGIDDAFNIGFTEGANFAGNENLRTVLNAIAEVTQTIYYLNHDNKLVFKRLDKNSDPVFTVTKKLYFELSTQTDKTISSICHATELGDNVYSGNDSGVTQYLRDNPLLENRTDIALLLDNAVDRISGLTIGQLNCDWEGNHLLEIGDKVAFETEDSNTAITFIIDDTINFKGYLNEVTSWEFTQDDGTTAANPTTIGERLNQTFARVDKVNQEITLVAEQVADTSSELAEIKVSTDSINLRVENIESENDDRLDALSSEIENLTREVNLKVSSEDVVIAISNTINEGVDKVVTSTKKYTFDDEGLSIGSSDSSINTTITEDGMKINRAGEEVLTADNTGVKAEDLHATTYLIIGNNSRFEDWQSNYTACFWLGGN